ncbi:hypothetical protein KY289_000297 [Solanum tuberosum]|nr:hypothetical protein KY289_000297 [Solanum tuberosum]
MRLQYLDKQIDKNHKDNGMVGDEQFNGEKFQGDLRQILNEKRGLANIDQNDTLVLSAKDDVTSDSMVPMINLESDLDLNPKLPTAGVLSGKDSSLATIQDSGQANKDNDKGGSTEVKTFSLAKLQQLDCTNPPRKEQTINCEDKVSRKIVCSNNFDALMIDSNQELHALSTPIL